ncbi:MAG TPA: hypothetical protein VFC09_01660 [Candidatus Dormibacteraeota bacterium]|nr:hypothetical protein [Candidatus Dormibacteraeota bacterium]
MRRPPRRRYDKATYYRGVRMVPYDIVKELVVALGIVGVLVLILSAALSSPDVPALTIAQWSQADPVDFVTTATGELSGSSTSSDYGPPYNNGSGAAQSLWFFNPQSWAGVHQPVDSSNQFVVQPLQQAAPVDSELKVALDGWANASASQQSTWTDAYTKALADATVQDGKVAVKSGDYGPLPVMTDRLLTIARSGGLDGLLLATDKFFQTDYTRPLLFMGDGGVLSGQAEDQKLTGSQWGMMNETGRYPGQAWLWLYTLWYQVAPFNRDSDSGFLGISSANADLGVVFAMGALTLLLLLVPFVPGLRDLPRWIPVHRLIWKRQRSP